METQIMKCYWIWDFSNCLSSSARALFHTEHLAEMTLRDFEFAQICAIWDLSPLPQPIQVRIALFTLVQPGF